MDLEDESMSVICELIRQATASGAVRDPDDHTRFIELLKCIRGAFILNVPSFMRDNFINDARELIRTTKKFDEYVFE